MDVALWLNPPHGVRVQFPQRRVLERKCVKTTVVWCCFGEIDLGRRVPRFCDSELACCVDSACVFLASCFVNPFSFLDPCLAEVILPRYARFQLLRRVDRQVCGQCGRCSS